MKTVGPLLRLWPESLLLLRAYKLLASMYQASLRDPFSVEHALFDFLMEYERTAFYLLYPASEREKLLQQVRTAVLNSLRQPLGVEELAERYQPLSDDFRALYPQLLALAGRRDNLPGDRPRLDMHQT